MRSELSRPSETEVAKFFATKMLEGKKSFSEIRPELQKCTEVALRSIDKMGEILDPKLIDGAIERLQSRKVGWLSIVLGFVSLIFARWAWNKYEENKQIDEETKKLQQLAVRVSASTAVATLSKIETINCKVHSLLTQTRGKWSEASLRQIKNICEQLQASQKEARRKLEEFEGRIRECPTQDLEIPQEKLDASEVAKFFLQEAEKKIQEISSSLSKPSKANVNSSRALKLNTGSGSFQSAKSVAPATTTQAVGRQDAVVPTCNGRPVQLGACGIRNSGNACYAIAALQAIRFNPLLRQLVERELPTKEPWNGIELTIEDGQLKNRRSLQSKIRAILNTLDKGVVVSSEKMRDLIAFCHNSMGWEAAPGRQADTHEFLSFLFNELMFAAKSETDAPGSEKRYVPSKWGFAQKFEKFLRPETAKLIDGHGINEPLIASQSDSPSFESMVSIEMDRGRATNPYSVLQRNASGMTMGPTIKISQTNTSDEAVRLRQCVDGQEIDPRSNPANSILVEKDGRIYNAGTCYERALFYNTPPLITLHLKRLVYNESKTNRIRIPGAVEISDRIDIRPLLAENTPIEGSHLYQLSSVIVHTGSATGGHYYMYQRTDDGKWICCNDSTITLASDFEPSRCEGSYIIMYRQIPA